MWGELLALKLIFSAVIPWVVLLIRWILLKVRNRSKSMMVRVLRDLDQPEIMVNLDYIFLVNIMEIGITYGVLIPVIFPLATVVVASHLVCHIQRIVGSIDNTMTQPSDIHTSRTEKGEETECVKERERERERVCVCVCVREREREREDKRMEVNNYLFVDISSDEIVFHGISFKMETQIRKDAISIQREIFDAVIRHAILFRVVDLPRK